MKYRRPLPFKILQIFLYLLILFILFYPYSFFLLQTVRQGNLSIQNTFMIQYDYIRQGIPYYREFFRLLQQHSLFWSWNTFLGNPFYTSKSLFLIGDPYAWLGFLLFQKIRYVPTVLFLLTGFKLLLSGLLFSSYIKRLGHSRSAQTFFGIVYMLSGWSMVFLEQIQFLSFYSFIPLFLSGIEEQLNPHRKTWNLCFYIASLLLLLVNYYLLWALCLYAVVYWIIRWHQIHPSAGRIRLFKDTGKLLYVFILAVGTSAPLTLPSLFAMLQSPRLQGFLNRYTHWSFINVCAIVMNFFIPFVREENMLYHDYWYYFYQIGIYGGATLLLLTPQSLFNAQKPRTAFYNRILLAFVLGTLTLPQFGLLFHRTYSLRYTFIVLLAMLFLSSQSFQRPIQKKLLLIHLGILETIIFLLAVCIPHILYSTGLFPRFAEQKMLWAAGLFLLADAIFLLLKNQKARIFFLTAAMMAEMLLFANHSMRSQSRAREEAEYLAYDTEIQEIMQRLHQMDSSFFRVDLETGFAVTQVELANAGMYYGIPSLSGYDSLYESAIRDYLQWNGQYPDVNWDFHLQDSRMFGIGNARYTICSPKYQAVRKDEPVFTSPHFAVYKNPEAVGMAYARPLIPVQKLRELAEEPEKNADRILNLLQENIVTDIPEAMDNGPFVSFDPVAYTATTMDFSFSLSRRQLVFFSIPKASGWRAVVNGKETPLQTVNGGFIGLRLSKGVQNIRFSYTCPGLKPAIPIALVSMALALYATARKRKTL